MFDFPLSQALAAFMLSLLGGLHCAGMCGGFIGALQMNRPHGVPAARLAAGYHLGRIASYTLAGALVGAIGGGLYAADVLPVQLVLLVLGSAMLIAIGIAMFGENRWLKRIEPIGAGIWRIVGPWARRVYPPRSGGQAFAAGLAWGWIPCGMVYAALPLALVAGGPQQGALVMLAFGLGTLPNLLLVDVVAARSVLAAVGGGGAVANARSWLRPLAGVVMLVFAISGLAHAARVAGADHPAIEAFASICHTPRAPAH
ncbi:MAG: sulfite exporter TauE/SafE family protein [Burkholderiaceae bacterium]|nr:sulfite exporter TauE/SafE family protein [Burkholderiaceae bacterium]